MLVPRSFKYSSTPLHDSINNNHITRPSHNTPVRPQRSHPVATHSLVPVKAPMTLTTAMPAPPLPSKPVEIPSRRISGEHKIPRTSRKHGSRKHRDVDQKHRPDALPPAVAALLAVTAIPPPRSQSRRRRTPVPDMSIDELIQEWRKETAVKSSDGSASLNMLLTAADEDDYEHMYSSRSTSCDSIPSLEGDDNSLLSISNPATPDSIRSRKFSNASSRKEKSFYTPESEECGVDHPLGLAELGLDDGDYMTTVSPTPKERRQRKPGFFRSNLSSSLQALKSKVSSSISSLNLSLDDDSFSDASLWQHPYIFPRLSSELRPTPFASTPSRSQRRYFNPPPVSVPFEEQQHHWQKALSSTAPVSLHDDFAEKMPMIQMQTYNKRGSSPSRRSRRNSQDSRSEGGRAMSGQAPMPSRQREPRENGDFLRVVVLEMNMRRGGKLEDSTAGRARIWLPARKQVTTRDSVFADDEDDLVGMSPGSVSAKKIPRRWVGISIE